MSRETEAVITRKAYLVYGKIDRSSTGITDDEILRWLEFVEICKMCAVNCRGLRFGNNS